MCGNALGTLPCRGGAVVVPTGPTYANSDCDALRRRVVTFDGFCPVKKPRVPEEASGVAVGRGRLSLGPTGPTYANSDCDVLRRRVVTSDGFWPVKEPRVSKEAPLIGGHGPALKQFACFHLTTCTKYQTLQALKDIQQL